MMQTPAARKSGPPGAKPPAGKRRGAPFEIDRVVAMRVALVVVVGLFLYMILRISMIAFGGSATREVKRIERATDGMVVREHARDAEAKPAAAARP